MSEQQNRRTVVSFVNRGGRMTVGQQRAWDERWPTLGRTVSDLEQGPLDFVEWFDRDAPVLLEIGSGMGETTSVLAAQSPELNYLACEVYEPGLAQLILRAENLGVSNLRLLRGDAITVLDQHVAPNSLAGARIFFPDPWPKKRHHKRRLISTPTVALLASRLRPGARLHMATDWAEYAEQMLQVCNSEPQLRNEFDGYAPRPSWRPRTKFEQRADAESRESQDLMFIRV